MEPNDSFFIGGVGIDANDNPVLYNVSPSGPGFEPLLKFNLPPITLNEAKPMQWGLILSILGLILVLWKS